ncbi:hypothetical protein ACFQZJ_05745 [Maribacter chungangensis]|uniref:Periplasmic heavy metal sensor n=1 Tax=Maribacter chungangensis TaxID=1069117 RepID=A0ABW3B0Z4_9FLAO
MFTKTYPFLTVLFVMLFLYKSNAQADCVLGVGVVNDSVLTAVFQLNPQQSEKLASFSAELKYRNEILDNTLANIRKRHPQSTVQELSDLAKEYNVMMDSIHSVQTMIEKRLLTLFNQKQYTLYRNLCLEASRSPFLVTPSVYRDTTVVKKRTSFLDNLDDKN